VTAETRSDTNDTPARRPGRLLLAGLALGCAFDLLFNGKLPGIFGAHLHPPAVGRAGSGHPLGNGHTHRCQGVNLWLPAALLFFAVMCCIGPAAFSCS